jgi:cell division protein FtsQ
MTVLAEPPQLSPPPAEPGESGPPRRPASPGRRWAVLVAIVVCVALLVWLVAFSPVLGARTVRVKGAHTVSAEAITRAAAVPHGRPLVRISTAAIAERIERSIPRIASATVSVSFPSTVVISVTERVAVAYVTVGNSYGLVDRTGRRFATQKAKPALPHLVASGAAAGDAATLAALATVAAALTKPLLAAVVSINGDDPNHITVLLTKGRTALWGTAERSADKATLLAVLIKRPGSSFDISDPDYAIVR